MMPGTRRSSSSRRTTSTNSKPRSGTFVEPRSKLWLGKSYFVDASLNNVLHVSKYEVAMKNRTVTENHGCLMSVCWFVGRSVDLSVMASRTGSYNLYCIKCIHIFLPRNLSAPLKVAQTRLALRSNRPEMEACRDSPHYRWDILRFPY